MKILAYSERGLINSLFYEIMYSGNNSIALLKNLLGKIIFRDKQNKVIDFSDATIMLEQSFSDFGDCDVVLLLSNNT
jgi:hypothetical protein